MEDINSLLEIERLEQARMKRKSKSQSRRNTKEARDESLVHDISEQLMGDMVKNVMSSVAGSNKCFSCGCVNDTTDDDGESTWEASTAKSFATSITSVVEKSSVATSIMSCMDKSSDGEYSTSAEDDWSDTSSLTDSKVFRPRKFFRNKIFNRRNNGTSKKYSKEPRKVFGLKERYEC